MPRSVPQVAHCDDYDSDNNAITPGTRQEARRKTMSSRPPKALDRYRSGNRDNASDSGYSSHTSGTHTSTVSATAQSAPSRSMPPPPRPKPTVVQPAAPPVQAPARPSTAHGAPRSKPVVHGDSQRTKERPPSRSGSISRSGSTSGRGRPCGDPQCQDPTCPGYVGRERRYSMSQQPAQFAAQYAASPAQYTAPSPAQYTATPVAYQQVAQYQYQPTAQPYQYTYTQVTSTPTTPAVPAATPRPRERSASASRAARPVSFHGYSYPSVYGGTQPGPPPSASAYQNMNLQNMQYAAWSAYQQQQPQRSYPPATYGAVAAAQPMSAYPQPSPTSPKFGTIPAPLAPGLSRTYSARAPNTGYDSRQPPSKGYSARRQPTRTATMPMPGAFPREPDSSDYSESDSSDSEYYSDEEYEREQRARARDSRLMSSSSQRRPSIRERYATDTAVPTRSSRELVRRRPLSDSLDYVSSDNVDSDRTARAVVDRPRTNYSSSSRSSRRPSISTTASSNRTKATTMSSNSGMAHIVTERYGRRTEYLSKRDQERARRQMEERENDVEAYQDEMRGGRVPELTAENIRRQQQQRDPRNRSSTRSRRASRSPTKTIPPDHIEVEINGAYIRMPADSTIDIKPGLDGEQGSYTISTGNRRDSKYHGSSRRSSSRSARSHGSNDVAAWRQDTIHEEDGFSQAVI